MLLQLRRELLVCEIDYNNLISLLCCQRHSGLDRSSLNLISLYGIIMHHHANPILSPVLFMPPLILFQSPMASIGRVCLSKLGN